MTGLLIDTHAAVWWWQRSPRLSRTASEAIAAQARGVWVSAISAIELAIKHRIGKFTDIGDPAVNYPKLMIRSGFIDLPITQAHALAAGLLPGEHRDPFDRIIAAQALAEGLTVVTRDPAFAAFCCPVLW